jgi:very-short-patch-repair endonuclease
MRTREPSRGEVAAWKKLRLLRAEGFAFRREHKIGPYWADFVCLRRRLIVEVDGGVHDLPGKRDHDAKRDAWLALEGFRVMRFTDAVILSERNWLREVRSALQEQPEAPYRWKTAPHTTPIKGMRGDAERDIGPWWEESPSPEGGGGRGRGEGVERDIGPWWQERE